VPNGSTGSSDRKHSGGAVQVRTGCTSKPSFMLGFADTRTKLCLAWGAVQVRTGCTSKPSFMLGFAETQTKLCLAWGADQVRTGCTSKPSFMLGFADQGPSYAWPGVPSRLGLVALLSPASRCALQKQGYCSPAGSSSARPNCLNRLRLQPGLGQVPVTLDRTWF
jgi:hypothetical protein